LTYEGSEQITSSSQHRQLIRDRLPKVRSVGCSEVGESCVLRVTPNAFVRVEIRSVGRQLLRHDARMPTKVFPNDNRSIVNVDSIPHDCHGLAEMPVEQSQELDDILGVDVFVVRQQVEVQPDASPFRAHRDGADRRDPISPIPAVVRRRLSAGCESSSNRRSEHKAGFIEENERCFPPARVFFRRRNSSTRQRSISSSSRSRALFAGFCDVHASRCTRILRT